MEFLFDVCKTIKQIYNDLTEPEKIKFNELYPYEKALFKALILDEQFEL